MQKLIKAAVELEDKEKQEELIRVISNHMKKLYVIWNKDTVEDAYIFEKLNELSQGKLTVEDGTRLMESKDLIQKKHKKIQKVHRVQKIQKKRYQRS